MQLTARGSKKAGKVGRCYAQNETDAIAFTSAVHTRPGILGCSKHRTNYTSINIKLQGIRFQEQGELGKNTAALHGNWTKTLHQKIFSL